MTHSSPPSEPIPTKNSRHHGAAGGFLASSLTGAGTSPLAEQALARDLAECHEDHPSVERGRKPRGDNRHAAVDDSGSGSDEADPVPGPTLYRRPSGIAYGAARPTAALLQPPTTITPTPAERARSRDAERSLLRDNHLLPPKHPRGAEPPGLARRAYRWLFSTKVRTTHPPPLRGGDEEAGASASAPPPDETTALLGGPDGSRSPPPHHEASLNQQWEAAVAAGQIRTTWQREAKTIAVYSRSLIVTFLLQYSLNVTSILAVGRLGTVELGGVSLATMTATITCYAPIQGLATSLDTLCAQAYGSGHKHLVGLQLQRMTYFLLLALIPVAAVWLNAETILTRLGIHEKSAAFAGMYLKIVLLGTPANAAFEGGKRFVQAQGIFHATTYVLLIAAPTNMLLNWLFVWKLGFGFVGAPMAVALTQNMLPVLLALYVWRVDGSQAWGGFRWAALRNWGPMVRLALPGMIMVVAEWFAFEILTLASGRMGVAILAAQSILVTTTGTTFQLPFPVSIAGSTRVANLIGAKLVDAAKISARVTIVGGVLIGLFNMTLLTALRYHIPRLFTTDQEVIELVARTLPVCAVMQIFDGMAAVSHGLLRGLGRQEFGGYANLVCYYLVALPISFGLGFGLDWKLPGLWMGVTFGLLIVSLAEYWFMWRVDWNEVVKEAEERNARG
ncbi:hypothetical protein VTJ83DRAFT_4952 [Remersonia thermophila]|uniref:MATE efflux family protein n=1 Tax=Remersonia thermophila TaxID=72144 RepID=A0ABR4DC54_9PEZI